ncbi:MAG: hypothetical protein IH987_22320, partial [Planctomycetes bacterium]|nr:hypothetical protein [Planctomycetota bacterium]
MFSKEFEVDQEASTAELRAVADFNHLTVSLNGRPVAEVADYGPMARVDVTQHLRRGNNRLSVRSESSAGPAAIAVRLDVTLKDGTRRSIVSDSTWQAFLANDVDSNDRDHKPIHAGDAVSIGKLADEPWGNFMRPVGINEVDDYTQWKQALGSDVGTDPSTFVVPEGYQIELLRSAGKDEGSWISIAFDPKGRLVIAREDKGLLRLALPKTKHEPIELETINDSLLECRGLLFAFGSLYVNANNSKGFYRLRDTNGDDRYDEVKLLYRSTGSVGHGRNDLALGPDNMIYLIHGDAVDLPKRFADKTSPFREHRRGIKTRGDSSGGVDRGWRGGPKGR